MSKIFVDKKDDIFDLYVKGYTVKNIKEKLNIECSVEQLDFFCRKKSTMQQKKHRELAKNEIKEIKTKDKIDNIFNLYAHISLWEVKRRLKKGFYFFTKMSDKEQEAIFSSRGYTLPVFEKNNNYNKNIKKTVLSIAPRLPTMKRLLKKPSRELPKNGQCKNYDKNDKLCNKRIGIGCKSYCLEHYLRNIELSNIKVEELLILNNKVN